ncbi:MAG: hypothetical protein HY043_16290 [Verrucomicrobia bacterium]|nr:hypothetical protein [Verrucomicrobiota bacterium]
MRNKAAMFIRELLRRCETMRLTCIGSLVLLAMTQLSRAAATSERSSTISFTNDIAPIFVAKCLNCHGPEKSKGGFRLDSFERLSRAGESKSPPLVAGQPERSELYRRLTTSDADDRMPQKDDPLPAAQIALVARWIQAGARFDGTDAHAPIASLLAKLPQPDPPAVYRRPVPIQALVFAPGGEELAVGSFHEITIWSPNDGRLLRRIKNVAERTHALAYSPDGSILASAGGTPGRHGEVKLFDPRTSTLLKTLATLSDVVLEVKFSPDGTKLAAAGTDSVIRIFDAASGAELRRIEQHADWVMAVAFNSDGTQLASASRDKTARIFNVQTGELESTYTGHSAPVFTVAFSADGKQVFSAGRDKKIHAWEVKEAKKLAELGDVSDDIIRLQVMGDRLFGCAVDGKIHLYSVEARKQLRVFGEFNDWALSLALDAKATWLAAGDHSGAVMVWNTEDSTLRTRFIASPGANSAQASEGGAQAAKPGSVRNER